MPKCKYSKEIKVNLPYCACKSPKAEIRLIIAELLESVICQLWDV